MQAYVISDSKDSLNGFRLIGMEGTHVTTIEELKSTLNTLLEDSKIALILITTKLYNLDLSYISNIKLSQHKKIILEVPDRHGVEDYPHKLDSYLLDIIGK
ncbi:MAG: V-type ATP synthase subunit F [Acholeplasmatales bacterium]|jgi:V/A-type H+-transporting ATPase subunit F|nr:V-type ATP synthase subunit F [Acholeplasmatales bacterium]